MANQTQTTPTEQKQGAVDSDTLLMTIPTGRIQEKVLILLKQIGISFATSARSYKPKCSESGIQAKMLKAQNIPALVGLGRHDCGFSGADWIKEQQADVIELLDLNYDPVRIVAAMPEDLAALGESVWTKKPLIVASEYRLLTTEYIKKKGMNAVYLQTFGATEALPPEDADMIVDNTATGSTLNANRLTIVDELMRSTTRFFANKAALSNPVKKQKLDEIVMLMQSALRAKEKVLLEMNVEKKYFDALVGSLPCMRAPTVSELYNGQGYAIKVAVPTVDVSKLIPKLIALGATDILEYKLEKIVV
ncbi:MAG: ATP phosphoribosyltransferase [Candidatus Obscuribacterales bacterium]|nr:ATP phosphoribosyltransferase [Candidatus Obscuribacterales bacterium]